MPRRKEIKNEEELLDLTEKSRKNKVKKPVTADNPGHIENRPVSNLNPADFMQIQINLLEIEKINLEINNIAKQIDNNEMAVKLMRMKIAEKNSQLQSIKNGHSKFIEDLKNRTGIDVRNKTIDFITGEVLDS
jgi:hypothetical protein